MNALIKLLFYTSIFFGWPLQAHYLVYLKKAALDVSSPSSDLFIHQIYPLLNKYTWPTSVAYADVMVKEFTEMFTNSTYNEEDVIKKKIKELNPALEIVFIPPIVYEFFALYGYHEGVLFNQPREDQESEFWSSLFHRLGESLRTKASNSNGSLKDMLLTFNLINDETRVKDCAYRMNRFINQFITSYIAQHPKKIESDTYEEIFSTSDLTTIVEELLKKLSEKLNTLASEKASLFQTDRIIDRKNVITNFFPVSSFSNSESLLVRIIDFERTAHATNSGILYRATDERKIYFPPLKLFKDKPASGAQPAKIIDDVFVHSWLDPKNIMNRCVYIMKRNQNMAKKCQQSLPFLNGHSIHYRMDNRFSGPFSIIHWGAH